MTMMKPPFAASEPDFFLQDFLQAAELRIPKENLQTLFVQWIEARTPETQLTSYLYVRTQLRKEKKDTLINIIEETEDQIVRLLESQPLVLTPEQISHCQALHFIVENEFPQIKNTLDEDIREYFRLRENKDLTSAKKIYLRITQKYPAQEERLCLMRYWRTHSPLFTLLFFQLKNELGERMAQNIRKSILFILRCFTDQEGHTALSLFTRIKNAVRLLPSDKNKAQELLKRLLSYAEKLRYHASEFRSVCEVLDDYFGESLFKKKEIRLVLPESENDPSASAPQTIQTFDFGHVSFSAEDLKLIRVNPAIQGLENTVLAYCYQYWLLAQDSDFENKVYLYAEMFKGPQMKVLQIIKKAQQIGSKDEDILYAIYNYLAKGSTYEYNVRKDIYMQSVWRRLKPGQENTIVEDSRGFAEEQIRIMREEKKRRLLKATETVKAEKDERRHSRTKAELMVQQKRQADRLVIQKAYEKVDLLKKNKEARKNQLHNFQKTEETAHPFSPVVEKDLQSEWTRYDGSEAALIPIAQRISAMDSSEQKNLHIIFRRRVESEIHAFLDELLARTGQNVKTVNKTLAVLAIKEFIFNNFDKDIRNWAISNERLKVKELGLTVTDIEPIIENCLSHLSHELAPAI